MSNIPNYEIPVTGSGSTPANIPSPPTVNGPMDLGQVNSQLQMGDRNPIGNQIVQQPVVPISGPVFFGLVPPCVTDNAGVQHAVLQPNQQANPLPNHHISSSSSASTVQSRPEDTYNGGLPWPPLNPPAGMTGSTKCPYGFVSFETLCEATAIHAQKRSPAPAPDDQNTKTFCSKCKQYVVDKFAFLILHLGEEHVNDVWTP